MRGLRSDDIIRAWEERVGPMTAHIKGCVDEKQLLTLYAKAIQRVDFSGKCVLDYGCGGGLFGEFLFANTSILQYVGLDIATRSLAAAEKLLTIDNDFSENCNFIKIDPFSTPDLSLLKIDILFCMNVIQHFPTQEYLDNWIEMVNNSGIENIILHFREGPLFFQVEPYKTTKEINLANTVPKKYIVKGLSNYKMIKSTGAGWIKGVLKGD